MSGERSQLFLFSVGVDIEHLHDAREKLMRWSGAANTVRAYATQWRIFENWCREAGRPALPAHEETAALYATWCIEQSGVRLATVDLRLNAIASRHRREGFPNPVSRQVRALVSYAARQRREEPAGKRALTLEHLRRIAGRLSGGSRVIHVRDRAIVVFGFALGWRRSEIAALNLADVSFTDSGVLVLQRWSKTDQQARGRLVGVQYGDNQLTCPVRALQAWLAVRGSWAGPLFNPTNPAGQVSRSRISDEMILDIVQRELRRIGEDPRPYGAHSLRSGLVTVAAENGASIAAIMQRTGHRCVQQVMKYVKPAEAFRANPLKGVL
jgi:integrase